MTKKADNDPVGKPISIRAPVSYKYQTAQNYAAKTRSKQLFDFLVDKQMTDKSPTFPCPKTKRWIIDQEFLLRESNHG
ncbi:MAG: hypothetical protein L0J89_07535 [Tetragenococcus koreensis]|uniref:Uncharacterized protein n=1 Tax=Tetragenococcus koreensis TaxID=290335 RepID=A0AAN4RKQ9_9ENTE|nr:hypothetical protein [Tetragenococcus koreensis]MDN6398495.1 hypothetical protein [Alkalibacterium sp.]AYW46544.1 hypothetical protein C7K43_11775 [Tetragenococcus koreensis]MDN6290801.1 hypothetical protein [Tetragenococcus koreensis]MDN6384427.1 hypothetical protein [Tetragenococcus koreensis]GEN91846.1 hypothetical protein TKO01_18920 [Tetragenococcus koreensis]